ncbi:MAG: hypothetical protein ACK5LK_05250 [Chthoniobacterales bacterium]
MERVAKGDADMAWLIYDLADQRGKSYELRKV